MRRSFENNIVRAYCPECRAYSKFVQAAGSSINRRPGGGRINEFFLFLECGGCARGAVAMVTTSQSSSAHGYLQEFYPHAVESLDLPVGVPEGVVKEFREAEQCAAVGALRGACALLRSSLEKVLLENGYTKKDGRLFHRIEKAAEDNVITGARRAGAQTAVRALGNDVLHEAWRVVEPEEYRAGHRYVQRVIEDLYDERDEVEKRLRELGRLKEQDEGESPSEDEAETGP